MISATVRHSSARSRSFTASPVWSFKRISQQDDFTLRRDERSLCTEINRARGDLARRTIFRLERYSVMATTVHVVRVTSDDGERQLCSRPLPQMKLWAASLMPFPKDGLPTRLSASQITNCRTRRSSTFDVCTFERRFLMNVRTCDEVAPLWAVPRKTIKIPPGATRPFVKYMRVFHAPKLALRRTLSPLYSYMRVAFGPRSLWRFVIEMTDHCDRAEDNHCRKQAEQGGHEIARIHCVACICRNRNSRNNIWLANPRKSRNRFESGNRRPRNCRGLLCFEHCIACVRPFTI